MIKLRVYNLSGEEPHEVYMQEDARPSLSHLKARLTWKNMYQQMWCKAFWSCCTLRTGPHASPLAQGGERLFRSERKVNPLLNSGQTRLLKSTCMPVSRDALPAHPFPRKLEPAGYVCLSPNNFYMQRKIRNCRYSLFHLLCLYHASAAGFSYQGFFSVSLSQPRDQ